MEQQVDSQEKVLHNMEPEGTSLFSMKLIIFLIILVTLGIGSGYLMAKGNIKAKIGQTSNITNQGDGSIAKGAVFGSNDTKTFNDTAEGILQEGGIEGEGQFHLVRPGGDSQNVYLVSSNIDLSKLKKRKIKVWGATQTAQKASWLMDAGKVEVLE